MSEYIYSGDKQTEDISYYLEDEQWFPSFRSEYVYSGDKMTESISYDWKDEQWVLYSKHEYTYSGDKKTEILYDWKDEQWVLDWKVEYTYSGDKEIELISYYWKDEQWVFEVKLEYTYSGDKQTGEARYGWKDNQWVGWDKQETTYNSHGDEEYGIGYGWNEGWYMSSSRSWYYEYIPDTDYQKICQRIENVYDSSGALTRTDGEKKEYYWTMSEVKGKSKKIESSMYRMGENSRADMPLMPETDTHNTFNRQRDMPFMPVNNAHR